MKKAAPPTDSIFKQALDHLPDGVLLVDADRTIVYVNASMERMWNVPADVLHGPNHGALLSHVANSTVDPDGFREEVRRLYGCARSSEDQIALKDGRIFSRRSVPFIEDGESFSRIWIFSDITKACQADIDPLTGLANRRAYNAQIEQIFHTPEGMKSGIAIMDVDNFKAYNDLYGHAAGDRVLQNIATLLIQCLEEGDVAYRMGGEEFLIASKREDDPSLIRFFESIRLAICDKKIPHLRNFPSGVVTASFGVSCFSGQATANLVMESADQALYRAKSMGRNILSLGDCDPSVENAAISVTRFGADRNPRVVSLPIGSCDVASI